MNFEEIYKISAPYTMTSLNRMRRLNESVNYVNEKNIEGDFVECGVFKGGSAMNMALSQMNFNNFRNIYLYDTFSGMTTEGEFDVNFEGESASRILRRRPRAKCICSLEEVKRNMDITKYPESYLHYIKGDVANTLKIDFPDKIAILRLDTDWYESTKIELEVLYPKLVNGGVLILDDYGYWKGARKATDDYFASINIPPKFENIDEGVSAVYWIKK